MSDAFTDDEIRAAVDQFLLREVSVSNLPSGARDVLSLRDAMIDMVTTALVMRPDAFLYVVWLATNKLKGLVSQQLSALSSLADSAPGITRPSKRIESTSELTNARGALLELNAGLGARTAGVRGSIGPAVDRFRRSLGRFLDTELAKNVVVAGAVVDTGENLRETVRARWVAATARHEEIVTLATSIAQALTALDSVSLPTTAIHSITSRMASRLSELEETMAGPSGVQQSRQALLDLMTMRTLLARAASFRSPSLVLAPKTGDAATATMVASDGVEAAVEGSVSGPYNYDPGDDISLSINTAASTPTIGLPGHSRAEIRSRAFSPWVANAGGEDAAFTVNFPAAASTVSSGALGVLASGVAAAATLAPLLAPDVDVTWDSTESQLVFQSTDSSDLSRILALTDTGARAAFVDWAFAGRLLEERASSPTAQDVVAAISSSTPLVDATVLEEFYGSFNGIRDTTPLDVIWDKYDQGVDLAVNTSEIVTSPSRNFESAGVRVGMALEIISPPASVGQFTIVAVSGNALTLDAAVPGPAATAAYVLGTDYRTVPDGARVRVTSRSNPDNTGYYRVAVGGGLVARIQLDRDLADVDGGLAVSVFTQRVMLAARDTTPASGIAVTAANPLGFSVGGEVPASLTAFSIAGTVDLLARGVRPGDVVLLTAPSSAEYTRIVSSVTPTQLVVGPAVVYEAGAWAYQVQSARVYSFEALVNGSSPNVSDFLASDFVQDFSILDALVGRLVRGAKYSGQIQTAVEQYESDLAALQTALAAYSVPAERSVDAAVQAMREQGLDRAADLFLALKIEEFFSMDPEGVSYSTWMVFQSARAARSVAPVSKFARGPAIQPEWRPLSFQVNPLDLRNRDGS